VVALILALLTSTAWGQAEKPAGPAARDPKPGFLLVDADLGLRGDTVEDLAFSPDGKSLAVACSASKGGIGRGARGGVSVWDIESRKQVAGLAGLRNHDVAPVSFSPDGKLLAVGDFGGGLLLWDLAGNGPAATIDARPPGTTREAEHSGSPLIGSIQFRPDSKTVVVFPSLEGNLRAWDVTTHRPIEPLTTARDLQLVDLHQGRDGKAFALGYSIDAIEGGLVGNEPTRLILWDLATKRAVWSKPDLSPFGSARFSADGRRIVLIEPSRDAEKRLPRQALVIDRATGQPICTHRSTEIVNDAELSDDGRILAIALVPDKEDDQPRQPGEIRLADAATGKVLGRIALDEPGWPGQLIFSADVRRLAANCNGSIKVWQVAKILDRGDAAR
jgi:WD40 repeat protein